MAIRFNKSYNKKIYNTVRNFNRKVKRLEKSGVTNLPDMISTRELKTNFQTRQALNKQLRLYSKFSERDATEKIVTAGGAKTTKWEKYYLQANIKDAIKFMEEEKKKSEKSKSEYRILRKDYQNNLQTKIDMLKKGLDTSKAKGFAFQKQIITDYLNNVDRMRQGYDSWLQIVNNAGEYAGVDPKIMRTLNQKFKNLSEQEFTDLYHEEGIVKRIFELQYQGENANEDEDIINLLTAVIDIL